MTKTRQNLRLPRELSDQIDRLAAKPGVTKSAIVADILRAHFARGENFESRVNKIHERVARIEKLQLLQIETLANFIRFTFSVVPPLAEADQRAAKALTEERFAAFIDQVARRRASGKSLVENLTRELQS